MGQPVIGGMVSKVLERPMGTPDLTPPKLPASRLPREAYTRIMLRAKEGDISPTRLDQLGVPKMRRIPQEPVEPSAPSVSAADLYEGARQPGDMAWNALPGPARETLQNELDRNGVQSARVLAERLAKVHRGWRRPGRIPQPPEEP